MTVNLQKEIILNAARLLGKETPVLGNLRDEERLNYNVPTSNGHPVDPLLHRDVLHIAIAESEGEQEAEQKMSLLNRMNVHDRYHR